MTAAIAAEFTPAEVVAPPDEILPETPEEALEPAPGYRPSRIADLIHRAKHSPPKPIVAGLLNEKEIAGLHGAPEVFKTIFTLQLAECLATGKPFLGVWQVPKPRRVYFLETEMHETALGSRLVKMYTNETPPDRIYFANEAQLKQFHRATDLRQKFDLLRQWLKEAKADVVVLDTANPFFRGKESPNDETTAGAFFDLLQSQTPHGQFRRGCRNEDSRFWPILRCARFAARTEPQGQAHKRSLAQCLQIPPRLQTR
jgi:hypothetical protein